MWLLARNGSDHPTNAEMKNPPVKIAIATPAWGN
jgi:hypothetical protein